MTTQTHPAPSVCWDLSLPQLCPTRRSSPAQWVVSRRSPICMRVFHTCKCICARVSCSRERIWIKLLSRGVREKKNNSTSTSINFLLEEKTLHLLPTHMHTSYLHLPRSSALHLKLLPPTSTVSFLPLLLTNKCTHAGTRIFPDTSCC